MAPELLDGKQQYSKPADMFSFGITLYQTMTEHDPYEGDEFRNPWQIAKYVTKGHRPPIPTTVPPEMKCIIEEAWAQQPEDRPVFSAVVTRLTELFKRLFFEDAEMKGGAAAVESARTLVDALFAKTTPSTPMIDLSAASTASNSPAISAASSAVLH